MGRVRASTTVDSERLRRCRELLGVPDSEVIDAALRTLHDRLVARAELEALEALPYEDDPELAWEASAGPDLPHDGEIP